MIEEMGQIEAISSNLEMLLDEFSSLFEDPTRLSPRREQNQAIRLFEGASRLIYVRTGIRITGKRRWRRL